MINRMDGYLKNKLVVSIDMLFILVRSGLNSSPIVFFLVDFCVYVLNEYNVYIIERESLSCPCKSIFLSLDEKVHSVATSNGFQFQKESDVINTISHFLLFFQRKYVFQLFNEYQEHKVLFPKKNHIYSKTNGDDL